MDIVNNLLRRGVRIPNPGSIEIGRRWSIDRISGEGVVIHPGCRISGEKDADPARGQAGRRGAGDRRGLPGRTGRRAQGRILQRGDVPREGELGLGAHVREGTLLEEEASGAHCVGLKQTILFPFVTLGSLINFCDCLMAGGTNRKRPQRSGKLVHPLQLHARTRTRRRRR